MNNHKLIFLVCSPILLIAGDFFYEINERNFLWTISGIIALAYCIFNAHHNGRKLFQDKLSLVLIFFHGIILSMGIFGLMEIANGIFDSSARIELLPIRNVEKQAVGSIQQSKYRVRQQIFYGYIANLRSTNVQEPELTIDISENEYSKPLLPQLSNKVTSE